MPLTAEDRTKAQEFASGALAAFLARHPHHHAEAARVAVEAQTDALMALHGHGRWPDVSSYLSNRGDW